MKSRKKEQVPEALDGKLIGVISSGMKVYRVHKLDEEHADQLCTVKYGYRLFGPGGNFYLMRNMHEPSLMFVIDREGHPSDTFKNVWFTDSDGQLKIA